MKQNASFGRRSSTPGSSAEAGNDMEHLHAVDGVLHLGNDAIAGYGRRSGMGLSYIHMPRELGGVIRRHRRRRAAGDWTGNEEAL